MQKHAKQKRILVAGREEGFSPRLIKHALEMAKRHDCAILALITIPVSKHFFALLDDHAQEHIIETANGLFAPFRAQATERDIFFEHMTRVEKMDAVVREIQQTVQEIRFVLTEPDSGTNALRNSVSVYSMEIA